jgi:hypothetical protein
MRIVTKRDFRNVIAVPFLIPIFLFFLCAACLLALFLWLDDNFLGIL